MDMDGTFEYEGKAISFRITDNIHEGIRKVYVAIVLCGNSAQGKCFQNTESYINEFGGESYWLENLTL